MTYPLLIKWEPKSQTRSFQAANLNFPSLRHGFFTREGENAPLNCALGESGCPENVGENRRRVADYFSVAPHNLLTARQPHSSDVVIVDHAWADDRRPEADSMVTRQKDLVLGVLTADCAPVLLADPDNGVIAAAHVGWRGLAAEIISKTVAAMESAGADRGRIRAAIGPCIGPQSYEVGTDLRDLFARADHESCSYFKPSPGHALFDLAGYAQHLLYRAGVLSVTTIPIDSFASEHFYSARRRAKRIAEPGFYQSSGLQISAIGLGSR